MLPAEPQPPKKEEKPPYEETGCRCCKEERVGAGLALRDKFPLPELTTYHQSTVLVCPSCDGIKPQLEVDDRATE